MVEEVYDRHSGDLNGRLRPFDPEAAIDVRLVLRPEHAGSRSAQHLLWMLVNQLARAEGIVATVFVDAPDDVDVHPSTVPFGSQPRLLSRLVEAGSSIGVAKIAPFTTDVDCSYVIVVSDRLVDHLDSCSATVIYTWANNWWGAASCTLSGPPSSWVGASGQVPIGAYTAAALACAEVFLRHRLPTEVRSNRPAACGWDMWTQTATVEPAVSPPDIGAVDMSGIGLAGVGAVGAVWQHTIWASPQTHGSYDIADADSLGITKTNLNRGVLFTRANIGQPKATTARLATDRTGLLVRAWDGPFPTGLVTPRLLISAVDKNSSREALQNTFPARILSASTRDLRAEVLRCGPPGSGACLRCFNPPEPLPADDDIRQRALDPADHGVTIRALAQELRLSPGHVEETLRKRDCDVVGDRLLEALRQRTGNEIPEFSVGFTSLFAGVQLAAETLKLKLGVTMTGEADPSTPTSKLAINSAAFQFMRPGSRVNGSSPLARDPRCPACEPTRPGTKVWSLRYWS